MVSPSCPPPLPPQVGEQSVDGLLLVVRGGPAESGGVLRGGGPAGRRHGDGGVEVPVHAQGRHHAALQRLSLPHLASPGLVPGKTSVLGTLVTLVGNGAVSVFIHEYVFFVHFVVYE